MTNRRAAAIRVDENIANARAPPHDNQSPPQDNQVPFKEQALVGNQVLIIPPAMTDRDLRSAILSFYQTMTTQAHAVTTKWQAMIAQAN